MATKSSHPATQRQDIPHDKVAERARKLWMERGSPGGRDLEHWLEAERQLRDEQVRGGTGSSPSQSSKKDLTEAEKRLDGLVENPPKPARRTPSGERL